jgi:hypothetical protein
MKLHFTKKIDEGKALGFSILSAYLTGINKGESEGYKCHAETKMSTKSLQNFEESYSSCAA